METVVVGARGSRLAQAMVAEYLAQLGGPCPVVKFKTLAEAQRLVASVARRGGHHDHAQTLTLAAALAAWVHASA